MMLMFGMYVRNVVSKVGKRGKFKMKFELINAKISLDKSRYKLFIHLSPDDFELTSQHLKKKIIEINDCRCFYHYNIMFVEKEGLSSK